MVKLSNIIPPEKIGRKGETPYTLCFSKRTTIQFLDNCIPNACTQTKIRLADSRLH